ncbi:MAG: hypothetical protein ACRCZQ_10040 [Bacteroidales bacterium]
MDLGDYLYLIIFLGVALFQIVSKSLGKKEIKGDEFHENKPEPAETKRKLKKEVYVIDSLKQAKPVVNEYVNPEFNTSMSSSELLQNQDLTQGQMKSVKCENNPSYFNLSDSEELKKAIIYSEIFGRKF